MKHSITQKLKGYAVGTLAGITAIALAAGCKQTPEAAQRKYDELEHNYTLATEYLRDYQIELRNDSIFIYNENMLIGSNTADADCWIMQVLIKDNE